jgi:hypothetical protein
MLRSKLALLAHAPLPGLTTERTREQHKWKFSASISASSCWFACGPFCCCCFSYWVMRWFNRGALSEFRPPSARELELGEI